MTDELKPVKCGCGGEAYVSINGFIEYHVVCALCGMRTDWFRSKDKAIKAWNRAMGATDICVVDKFAKDINVPRKGKWQRRKGSDCWECSECHAVLESDDIVRHNYYYCYHCGADMMSEDGYIKLEGTEHE